MALTESDGKKNKSYGNDKAALKAKAERVLVADLSANDIKLINYGKKHGLNVSEIKGVLDGTIKKPTGIFKK